MSSLVFALENHDHAVWGLHGSYVMAAANFGTLLGSLAGTVIESTLSEEQILSWGWRIPFLSGIVVSLSGFYLQCAGESVQTHEVNVDDHNGDSVEEEDVVVSTVRTSQNPLREAFRVSNLRPLVAASLVPMLSSGGFYLCFVWM